MVLKKENEDKDKNKKKEEDSDEDGANMIYDDVLLIEEYYIAIVVDSSFNWVIDSGFSIYVIFRKDVFFPYTSGEFCDVKLAHEGVLKCF